MQDYSEIQQPPSPWFSYYLLINGIIYINLYILTPRYLEKEKYQNFLGAVGLIFLTLFGITALQAIFYRFKGIKELNDTSLILLNFASSTLSIGLMLAGTSALLLLRHWMNHTPAHWRVGGQYPAIGIAASEAAD